MIRTNPTDFVPILTELKGTFNGNVYQTITGQIMNTNEGESAFQELIDYLNVVTPMHSLQWSEPLYTAAKILADAQGPTGQTGHTGPDGSTMQSRIESQMRWEKTIGENIMYNSMTPLEAVLNLCIDDGVSSRGHRTNIFKSNFYYTGVATNMHATLTSETVTTFTGSWITPSYTAPTIAVPQSVAAYTDYASWDTPSQCDSSSSGTETTPSEDSAKSTLYSFVVLTTALIASTIA